MRTYLIFSLLALALALGASAQTVTVAQSGTPTFGLGSGVGPCGKTEHPRVRSIPGGARVL